MTVCSIMPCSAMWKSPCFPLPMSGGAIWICSRRRPARAVCALHAADAVVVSAAVGAVDKAYSGRLKIFFAAIWKAATSISLNRPDILLDTGRLKSGHTAAVAGVAKPGRFFESLRALGIELAEPRRCPIVPIFPRRVAGRPLGICHRKRCGEAAESHQQIMCWVLPVCAIIEPDLAQWLIGHFAVAQEK